ncbi:MAG: flavin reductase family protein [Firmicutes bacterium]|nr:flavin reductase family protein [Bacillota bacterium]
MTDTKREMRPGEMLYPVPVVMATLGEGEEANIITIAWTGIINSKPPMTYISVRKERHSHPILMKNREFVINLCTEELVKATDYCGVKSGRDVDKFKEMGLTKEPADIVKCPMIKESPINLECKVTQVIELGSHDMFMAEIVKVHAADELFDEEGRMDPVKAGLVAYIHGEYYPVKRTPLGKFGYSIMKPKTKKRLSKEAHMKRVEKNKAKRNKDK